MLGTRRPLDWLRRCDLPLALLAVAVAAYAGAPIFTNDAFWHVATGAHLAEVRAFPPRDPFSYTTADKPWVLHEWLTQVLFWAVYAVGGWHGLRALTALLAVVIVALVHRLFRRELGHRVWGWAGVVLFLALGAERLQTRPTLFTIAFTLALVDRLLRHGQAWRRRDVAWVALLLLVWVNLHSIALMALGLYGAWLAGALLGRWRGGGDSNAVPLRRHALTLGLAALATLATPAGPSLYAFALQDKREVMQYIVDEWAPFHLAWSANESLRPEAYAAVLAVLAALAAIYLVIGVALQQAPRSARPWPDASRVLLAAALLAAGLSARRFHWMLALALLLAATLLRDLHRLGQLLRLAALARALPARVGAALALAAATALVYGLTLRVEGRALHRAVLDREYRNELCAAFRLDGVEFLRRAGLVGNAFCHYGSGGILAHALYPAIRVFIDSRVDLYRRDGFLEWVAVRDGRPDQTAVLDAHGTDIYYRHWEIVPPRDREAWELVWSGGEGEIYLRRNRPGFAANLRRARAAGGEAGAPTAGPPR